MFFAPSIQTMLVAAALATAALAPTNTAAEQASLLPTEDLIGEEVVTAANVNAFADRIFAETNRILSSGSWLPIPNFSGVKNEFKDVRGVFASSGVLVTRAQATVNAPAQTLFDYLVTAEGYQLIDPFSKPEDFAKAPIEAFATDAWRPFSATGTKRLEAAHTVSASVPIIKEREFVVLNAIDASTRTFVSKSIQHAGFPGCSKYGGAACYNATAERTRALNTFAVQIEPVATNATRQCVVRLVNYADFAGWEIPAVAMNVINFGFLPDMVGRMRAAFP